jgi:hypothetical protein
MKLLDTFKQVITETASFHDLIDAVKHRKKLIIYFILICLLILFDIFVN